MAKKNVEIVPINPSEITPLFERVLLSVREDLRDNTYITEALKVLPVGGYRSAIGCFWNAVVDDLRNKIIFRSLSLFNKFIKCRKEIKSYEDFQDCVNDDELIEGAYKIGVIGWEASKILKHTKETRHIFDGHPKSSEPSLFKVLAMMDDCIKYVLNAEYPSQIIDIDEYMNIIGSNTFDRNAIGIENALGDLPEIYKNELANRLFASYIHQQASSVLRSNIEFVMPILWRFLPKDIKIQIVRRVDQEINRADSVRIEQSFSFVKVVDASQYLSTTAQKYKLTPIIEKLARNLDNFQQENEAVQELAPYAPFIPVDLLPLYVSAITHTYVGHLGSSARFSRTDFYANGAAAKIPIMFEVFDDRAAQAFVECIKTSKLLKERIREPKKLRRLRALGNIIIERVSNTFSDREFLETLVNETGEEKFLRLLK